MLLRVLVQLTLVVGFMLAVATVWLVGRNRLVRTRNEFPSRLRSIVPIGIVLVVVLLVNSVVRQFIPDVSWMIGWELTWTFFEIEGNLVGWIQRYETPALTAYFSFVYVYGYAFLLIFPVVAYFALSETKPVRLLLTAYTINYTVGPLIYVFFIVYGPRNFAAEGLLYDAYPRYQHLTGEVNRNTNVFPSLHTSLSVTVAIFAYRTREVYRGWYPIALVLAGSVAFSTMYLGIHWAIDVVAGVALAYLSVHAADALIDRWDVYEHLEPYYERYVAPSVGRLVDRR
ncbi:phosphatase PAP2 family protein [Halovivax sp.]|uniref:phosphatase PAP2 family protein n=1 Tax=Halovivax sp. TaxID=1935978 RepID=UPI0025BCC481|nr:phosphatase PAP2 family protein [Halovivax sp.]